jgi:hypothetical protein
MQRLKVTGKEIVTSDGTPIKLHGVCVGGWMNMEHFLNGYPGSESRLRSLFTEYIGMEKTERFFDLWLEHLFNIKDITFLKKTGLNTIRIPLNYRHFESDMNPFVYLEKGFKRLDTIVRACEANGLYVILDLHSVQGWQNGDWHADNSSRHALFWNNKHFQDRFYALWKEIARRYKDCDAIAGYNIMNEPISNAAYGRFGSHLTYQADWDLLNAIYRKTVNEIHSVDADHIIFLEGDYFSTMFDGLEAPFTENLVYSSHNYIPAMTSGKKYPGFIDDTYWNPEKIRNQFLETSGFRFAQKHNVPLWVGEFGGGVVYPSESMHWQFKALDDHLAVFHEFGIHWTLWAYKDIGGMSVVQSSPHSPFNRIIAPTLEAKRQLNPDFGWLGSFPEPIETALITIENEIMKIIPNLENGANRMFFRQAAMSTYTGDILQEVFVKPFLSLSEKEWEEIFCSFSIENCIVREEMFDIFKKWI